MTTLNSYASLFIDELPNEYANAFQAISWNAPVSVSGNPGIKPLFQLIFKNPHITCICIICRESR
jgi:hypothetical protein